MPVAPRVLLAEDDPGIASVLALALGDEGYRVTHVATPGEVVAAVRGAAWDLFLLDTFDPHATVGPSESLRGLLRELTPGAAVLIMTAHTWASRISAEGLGVAAIVPKPFDLDELLATVKTVLGRA